MKLPRTLLAMPRRRFRDRLLAGMIVVALLPLMVFALLVAADLGGITSRTVDEAHRTISEDLRARELAAVADHSHQADGRLSDIGGAARQLRDDVNRAIAALPSGTPGPEHLATHGAASYLGSSASAQALVVRSGAEAGAGAPVLAGAQLQTVMAGFRHTYPELTSVWVMQRSSGLLLTVPGFDVVGALDGRRLSVTQPQLRGGQDVFAASQQRMSSSPEDAASAWVNPPSRRTDGPFWTDVYPLPEDGTNGLTVWMPLPDGNTLVGFDVSLSKLSDDLLASPVTDASAADTLLLSSSNMILAGSGDLHRDFGLPGQAAGLFLPLPKDAGFAAGLHDIEQTGRARELQVTIDGTQRDFIAQPVLSPHWILATAIPLTDFEPDLAALSRGVDTGIHSIYLQALPVLLLLLVLAFLLATVMSRRLVGPVRALTAAAGRLAAGRTEEAVPRQGEDEVGVLADSLERMRQDINASRETILAASRELEERVADRTRELRARNEELVALNELAGSLTRSLDPSEIVRDAISAVRAIVPTTAAVGFLLHQGRLSAVPPLPGSGEAPPDARLIALAERTAAGTDLVEEVEERSRLLGIPLDGGDGADGVLVVRTRRRRPTEQTRSLLRAIGDQVGLALRSAELSAAQQKTAVLSERARLAREIHDTLAQQLTAIVLQLEAAEGLVAARDGSRARTAVESAREMARLALQEARRSVWDLRPTPLTDTGLVAAMAAEVEQWRQRTGIAAEFHAAAMRRPLPLAPAVEVALLRILQEALSNVARHSQARTVQVGVRRVDDEVWLTVADDGRGFAAGDDARSGSFGLIGMAERARLAGGTLDVVSTPDGGTTLCARVALGDVVDLPA